MSDEEPTIVFSPRKAGALAKLAEQPDEPLVDDTASIEVVSRTLDARAQPGRVVGGLGAIWPWGEGARIRARAAGAALEARLDLFRDDLRAIRVAYDVLKRVPTMRAVEAAEVAILEIRARGEAKRLAIINQSQLEMTRLFMEQLEAIDGLRGRLTPEIIDALKERALAEFTERVNRASKADLQFNRNDFMRTKP